MRKIFWAYITVIGLISFSCSQNKSASKQNISLFDAGAFTATIDLKKVSLYTLTSGNGLTMQVTNFGGRVVDFWVPDRNGKMADIVLGYDSISRYIHNKGERFLGAAIGRYANRIAKGKFSLNGKEYTLVPFNNGQSLHGGLKGFDMQVWNVDSVTRNSIALSYVSPDGEEGFPGTLRVKMIYTLTPSNEFKITYRATTDKPTIVNLTHHSFWNLKGEGNGIITDHILTINASRFLPIDSVSIPYGNLGLVEGTPFDFRKPRIIGAHINDDDQQLKNGKGYDHNWVVDRKKSNDVEFIASLYEPTSGRYMEVWSDQPGLQFYSGNFFDGSTKGKYGDSLKYRSSLALEAQKFPDTPNHRNFPSCQLNPGEVYHQTCIYRFSVR